MQPQFFKRAKPLDELPSWFLACIGTASIPITLFLVFVMVDVLPGFLVKLWDVGLNSSALNLLVLLLILIVAMIWSGLMAFKCGKILLHRHF